MKILDILQLSDDSSCRSFATGFFGNPHRLWSVSTIRFGAFELRINGADALVLVLYSGLKDETHQFSQGVGSCLFEDLVSSCFYCADTDVQLSSDRLVGLSLDHQVEHVAFLSRQPCKSAPGLAVPGINPSNRLIQR
jgi:hypothetical protein